jgi:ribosomal protein S18 acetylase RimI-like enzyme
MLSRIASCTTKELSEKTWADFVELFSRGNGWDHCFCMHFHRPHRLPKEEWLPTRAERAVRNRWEKLALVKKECSHGVLVYAQGQPVGWCQYGLSEELPRIDSTRNYKRLPLVHDNKKLWRITCFVVDTRFRNLGVATAALYAALESIRKEGGGVVEAYPISRWLPRAFGSESTSGTVSMFKKAGFKLVAQLGSTKFSAHVLMRRTV